MECCLIKLPVGEVYIVYKTGPKTEPEMPVYNINHLDFTAKSNREQVAHTYFDSFFFSLSAFTPNSSPSLIWKSLACLLSSLASAASRIFLSCVNFLCSLRT